MVLARRLLSVAFLIGLLFSRPTIVSADNDTEGAICSITVNGSQLSTNQSASLPPISPAGMDGGQGIYQIRVCGDQGQGQGQSPKIAIDTPGVLAWAEFPLTPDGTGCYNSTATLNISQPTGTAFDVETGSGVPICRRAYGNLQGGTSQDQALWDDSLAQMCAVSISPSSNITITTPVTIQSVTTEWFRNRQNGGFFLNPQNINKKFRFFFMRGSANPVQLYEADYSSSPTGITYNAGILGVATYSYEIREYTFQNQNPDRVVCQGTFTVGTPEDPGGVDDGGEEAEFNLCKQTADADEAGPDYQACVTCFDAGKFWTAFGCVGTTKEGIVTSFIRIGIGLAGGFVLLSILYGAFLLTTSSGEPKRVQEGQEMISSAVMGLFFVVFSILILRFIGVSILKIPGFGG